MTQVIKKVDLKGTYIEYKNMDNHSHTDIENVQPKQLYEQEPQGYGLLLAPQRPN